MYIEYIRNQWEARGSMGTLNKKPGIECPIEKPRVPEFKPTWLVRISDMQVVPGSSINKHYWALSYSWNQSGELIHKGGEEYERIDEGRHRIIEYKKTVPHILMNDQGFGMFSDIAFHDEPASTISVTFERLVQEICKDLSIDYIWYDQICINQDDHDAKMREIKQMHLIYTNALCTLALIPELRYTWKKGTIDGYANVKKLPRTQWCKRMWTLEEAYVSKNILFLGHNVHIWSDVDFIWKAYTNGTSERDAAVRKWIACTALWYSRNRTSSKSHDRIFALANIFPELMSGITFSYKQPVQNLMIKFYRDLAQKDISVLLFGVPNERDPEDETMAVRQKEANLLPSWTGENGVHITQLVLMDDSPIGTADYKIFGDCMRLTTSFVTVSVEAANALEKPDDFDNPDRYPPSYDQRCKITCKGFVDDEYGVIIERQFTDDGLPMGGMLHSWSGRISDNACTDLVCVATTNKSDRYYAYNIRDTGLKPTHVLPFTVENQIATNSLSKPKRWGGLLSLTEECSKCIILCEPAFQAKTDFKIYPVIKKEKDSYRSIGVCALHEKLDIAPLVKSKQIFDIK
ncbi:hypothetical protein BJV82DRAFT_613137 [Fennellomyces sp. T-0311]|nr:hypothetical protein BJV82DRAFT_613137 [Fennellomyces sp. T-0311]